MTRTEREMLKFSAVRYGGSYSSVCGSLCRWVTIPPMFEREKCFAIQGQAVLEDNHVEESVCYANTTTERSITECLNIGKCLNWNYHALNYITLCCEQWSVSCIVLSSDCWRILYSWHTERPKIRPALPLAKLKWHALLRSQRLTKAFGSQSPVGKPRMGMTGTESSREQVSVRRRPWAKPNGNGSQTCFVRWDTATQIVLALKRLTALLKLQ